MNEIIRISQLIHIATTLAKSVTSSNSTQYRARLRFLYRSFFPFVLLLVFLSFCIFSFLRSFFRSVCRSFFRSLCHSFFSSVCRSLCIRSFLRRQKRFFHCQNGVFKMSVLGGHQLRRPLYSGRRNPRTSHFPMFL